MEWSGSVGGTMIHQYTGAKSGTKEVEQPRWNRTGEREQVERKQMRYLRGQTPIHTPFRGWDCKKWMRNNRRAKRRTDYNTDWVAANGEPDATIQGANTILLESAWS